MIEEKKEIEQKKKTLDGRHVAELASSCIAQALFDKSLSPQLSGNEQTPVSPCSKKQELQFLSVSAYLQNTYDTER